MLLGARVQACSYAWLCVLVHIHVCASVCMFLLPLVENETHELPGEGDGNKHQEGFPQPQGPWPVAAQPAHPPGRADVPRTGGGWRKEEQPFISMFLYNRIEIHFKKRTKEKQKRMFSYSFV